MNKRKYCDLTSNDIHEIIEDLMRHKWAHAEVAMKFKVKTGLV